jgi:hypothetical protein
MKIVTEILTGIAILFTLLSITGCNRIQTNDYNSPLNPVGPTNPVAKKDIVEFRVNGNPNSAVVRYNNSLDGLTVVNTALPYVIVFQSDRDNIFLLLEATPGVYSTNIQTPFLSVQIYVNGVLFREASSSSFLANTISISGTYRR